VPTFYDTHAHLDFPDFKDDLPTIIERAHAAGIEQMVSIGTDLETSRNALALTERFPSVHAAVGWHPGHALEAPDDIRSDLRELVKHPRVVAVGETGLDYYRLPSANGASPEDDARYKAKQAFLFLQQLEIAAEAGLNCVVHQRGDCFEDTMKILEPFAGKLRTVFHCFVGTPDQMRRVLDIGGLVSFTGIITFKNANEVRETLAATPLDRLMLETDCPYLAPTPHRGKRAEPAHVKAIAETVASVKRCSLEKLGETTCATAKGFFRGMN
jgi:TatD DNase family protein